MTGSEALVSGRVFLSEGSIVGYLCGIAVRKRGSSNDPGHFVGPL